MPWPPTIPPATRANATAELDAHPSDHNAVSAALSTIVARLTNTAWGVQAITTVTASGPTTVGTVVDLPNSTVTFQPVAGRWYLVWARALQVVSVAANVVTCRIRRTSDNSILSQWESAPAAANVGTSIAPRGLVKFDVAVAPVSYKLSYAVANGSGNTYLYADAGTPIALIVEDVGPVTPVVVP